MVICRPRSRAPPATKNTLPLKSKSSLTVGKFGMAAILSLRVPLFARGAYSFRWGKIAAMNLLCYYNPALIPQDERTLETDLCIYGGNAAGCVAAIQARKMGLNALVLEPGGHLG